MKPPSIVPFVGRPGTHARPGIRAFAAADAARPVHTARCPGDGDRGLPASANDLVVAVAAQALPPAPRRA